MRKSTKYLAAVAAIAIGSASPFMVAAQTMQKSPVRLADVMSAVQFRHSKLWTAGQQKNWELVGY
jgi:Spy/CpxP family protein refolding chaperone